jgi:hypothetical protein
MSAQGRFTNRPCCPEKRLTTEVTERLELFFSVVPVTSVVFFSLPTRAKSPPFRAVIPSGARNLALISSHEDQCEIPRSARNDNPCGANGIFINEGRAAGRRPAA